MEKVVVKWRNRDGREVTIEPTGEPTQRGNKMWTDSYALLSTFPEYLAGSHQYQLPWGRYELQITLQVKTNCDVYLCYEYDYGWNPDQLQRIGFVVKNEKITDTTGYKWNIYQKNVLGAETVILPESNDWPRVAIFVK